MSSFYASELVINNNQSQRRYWHDLWHYRELFYFLVWRDLLVRYKQTTIGIFWALLRPFITMVVFSLVFGHLAKLPAHGIPYPILVFTAILPWQLFASALSECSSSLVSNSNLIAKVYFPRLIIPMSAVIVSFVEFLLAVIILIGLMAGYKFIPSWHILTLPAFIGLALLASLGGGLWLAALSVKYRDFRVVVPFIVQIGLYISPVGFSSNVVPDQWRWMYSLNPMVSVIDGFRWAILGDAAELYWPGFLLSSVLVGGVFASGVRFFRNCERTFADVI